MSIALWAKKIRCPNCEFEGKAEAMGGGCGLPLTGLIILFVGFFLWPFLILSFIIFFIAMIRPAKQICPKCKWEHPIPI